ncbi:TPA: helix-turn-helix transcriptional regulator [Stenotrophomonas maltophilia]|nr:AlpA family phage regulatory protein [Stenotrophomonas maltophilia]
MASHFNFNSLPDSALLRIKDFKALIPFSEVTLWRRVKTGQFPAPSCRLSGRVTCWSWGSVRGWLEAQVEGAAKK